MDSEFSNSLSSADDVTAAVTIKCEANDVKEETEGDVTANSKLFDSVSVKKEIPDSNDTLEFKIKQEQTNDSLIYQTNASRVNKQLRTGVSTTQTMSEVDSSEGGKKLSIEQKLRILQKAQAQSGVRGQLVLIYNTVPARYHKYSRYDSPYDILNKSAKKAKTKIKIQNVNGTKKNTLGQYALTINDEEFACGSATSKKNAKKLLGKMALIKLQETCFTVKLKWNKVPYLFRSEIVKKKTLSDMELPKNTSKNPDCDTKIGMSFKQKLDLYIKNYFISNPSKNLIFGSEFTIDERRHIHEIARAHGLKPKNYGPEPNKKVVVSCQDINWWDVVKELIEGSDTATEHYKLIMPTKLT